MRYEDLLDRIAELTDQLTDHELAISELEEEIEELELEIEHMNESEWGEWRDDDAHSRAADMNATLADIGGGL